MEELNRVVLIETNILIILGNEYSSPDACQRRRSRRSVTGASSAYLKPNNDNYRRYVHDRIYAD